MLHKMAYHTTLAEARESLKTSRMSDSAGVDMTLKLARKRRLERSLRFMETRSALGRECREEVRTQPGLTTTGTTQQT